MKTFSIPALILPFVALVAACSAGDHSVGSDQSASKGDPSVDGGSCVTDNDCAASEHCGFQESDQCTALGRCFSSSGVECMAYSAGCACDGTEINVACTPFPSGYASKPLAHTGACGGASDASTGGPCNTTADCKSPNEACAYLASEACAAQGTCVAINTGPECAAYSAGCACDGSEINVACSPYPSGYVSKPLAHNGACNDAGK